MCFRFRATNCSEESHGVLGIHRLSRATLSTHDDGLVLFFPMYAINVLSVASKPRLLKLAVLSRHALPSRADSQGKCYYKTFIVHSFIHVVFRDKEHFENVDARKATA